MLFVSIKGYTLPQKIQFSENAWVIEMKKHVRVLVTSSRPND